MARAGKKAGAKPKKRTRRNRRHGDKPLVKLRKKVLRAARVLMFAAAAGGLSYGGYVGYGWMTTTGALAVETVSVTGAGRTTEEEVMRLSGGLRGRNILSFSTSEVEEMIERGPWVADARVRRDPPLGISIEITEREPLALVLMGELLLMDTRGVVFKKFSPGDGVDLPVVTGLEPEGAGTAEGELLELLTVLSGREGFGLAQVSEVNVDPVIGLTLLTVDRGTRLELGFGAFEAKLVSFEKVRAHRGTLAGVSSVDLTDADEVIVRFSSKAVRKGGVT